MKATIATAARTRQEATILATDAAMALDTYADAAKVCGRLWVAEMLPPDETWNSPIGDNLRFRMRCRDSFVAQWARDRSDEIADEVIAEAMTSLRSKVTKARLSLGMDEANGRLMLLDRLRKLSGY